MAVLGALNVAFTATTDKFEKGASVVMRDLKRIGALFTSTKAMIAGGLGLLGVGVGAAAFTSLVSSQMDAADANAKLSDRLSVSTEMIAGMKLQADLAGVSTEEFGSNLDRLVKNIGNAAIEGGELNDTFARLGLDAGELANVAPDEALFRIADAFKEIKNPAEQAKIATDLFGKAGQPMINVLKEGRAGFMAAAKEAEAFGIAITRIDAAKIERANDAWTKVKAIFNGIATQIAVNLAPMLELVSNKFIDMAKAAGGMGPLVVKSFEIMAKSIAFVGDLLDTSGIVWNVVQINFLRGISILIAGFDKLQQTIIKVANSIGIDLGDGGHDFFVAWTEELDKLTDRMNKQLEEKLVAPSLGEKVKGFFAELRREADKLGEGVAKANKEMQKLDKPFNPKFGNPMEKMQKQADDLMEDSKSQLERFTENINSNHGLLKLGLIDQNAFNIGALKQRKQLVDSIGGDRFQGAGALEFGSGEAVNELNRVQTETQLTLDQVLEEAKKQTALQQKIADNAAKEILAVLQIN